MSIYGYIRSGERREKKGACNAAEHVKDELLAKLESTAVPVIFILLAVPVLSTLADGFYERGAGGAEELS